MKSILDSSFTYTPSSQTDLRKTFDRIRRQQQAEIADDAYASRGASFESSRAPSCAGQLGGGMIPYPGSGVLGVAADAMECAG
jgi:hypothetical protein